MRSTVSKKSLILVIIFFVILTTVGSAVGFMGGKTSERGRSVKQYLLTEDVSPGHSLKGKYRESYVSEKISLDINKLVISSNDLDKGVASHQLYKNSPLSVTDVVELEDLNRNIEVSFPVSVTGSVANSIVPGDIVTVKLTYKDNNKKDAVVISRVKVKEVKSTSGTPVVDANTVVGYIIFDVTSEESSDVNNAIKDGSLYCAKYNDLTQEPLPKTYNVSGGTTVAPTETSAE